MGFLLLPLYTSYLTPRDYGIVAVVTSIMTVLTIALTLSLNSAGNRFYFEFKNDEQKLHSFWGSLYWLTIANSLILALLFAIFHRYLLQPFLGAIPFLPYALLGLISIGLNPAFTFYQSCIQAKQAGISFALNNFAFFLLNLALSVALIVIWHLGAIGVLLAQAITNIIFFIITMILFARKIPLHVKSDDIRIGLRYSLPLLPHALFSWTYSTIDRLLLNRMRSTSDTGLYNVAAQFGSLIAVISDSINKAYAPWFFESLGTGENGRKRIITASSVLVGLYSFLALELSLFCRELLALMVRGDFLNVWSFVPPITFGYVFGGIYYVVCNSLFIKKTHVVPLVTLSGAVISIALNLALIPRLGIMGAAVAGLSSQFITSLVVLFASIKAEPIDYKWKKMYFTVFFSMALSATVYFIPLAAFYRFGLKLAVTTIFCFGIFLLHRKDTGEFLIILRNLKTSIAAKF
jgi:O-antigen/teichoic acid export membrane protein